MLNAVLANLQEFWIVHLLLGLYTALLVYHAYVGHKGTKGITDYYVGGRGMGGVALGLSFFATYSSTNSFVGFSGQAYTWGTPWLLLVPFIVGFSFFAWAVVAPRLRVFTRSLDSLTVPDFIGFRFESTAARVLAAVIVLMASLFYMTAVFKGIGNLLETFMDIPYRVAIGIIFVVVMVYTAVGGFISVVKTDAVQGIVMAIAAFLLFFGTVGAAGGLDALGAIRDAPATAHLFTWGGGVAVPTLFGVLVAGTIKFAVEPRQLSPLLRPRGRTSQPPGHDRQHADLHHRIRGARTGRPLRAPGYPGRAPGHGPGGPHTPRHGRGFLVTRSGFFARGHGRCRHVLARQRASGDGLDRGAGHRGLGSTREFGGDGRTVDPSVRRSLRFDHGRDFVGPARGHRNLDRSVRRPVRRLLLPGDRAGPVLATRKWSGGDRFIRRGVGHARPVEVHTVVRGPSRGLPGTDPLHAPLCHDFDRRSEGRDRAGERVVRHHGRGVESR